MVRDRFSSCLTLSSPAPLTALFSFFLLLDVNSALGYLHPVTNISEVHIASILFGPEDGGSMYLRSIASLPTSAQCKTERAELTLTLNLSESLKSVIYLANVCFSLSLFFFCPFSFIPFSFLSFSICYFLLPIFCYCVSGMIAIKLNFTCDLYSFGNR
jgi:hypothetical protein